nr:DUF5721 family protein [uncultured Marvinbryantia sp.]
MLALQITEVKPFMNKLFLGDTFDGFQLSEAVFVTFNTFHIDGSLQKEYYSSEELEMQQLSQQSWSFWRQLRPFCLSLIKGKHTPLEFKIVFRLAPTNVERLVTQSRLAVSPADIDGLFLNLHFRQGALTCTTGSSLRFFTLDKTVEHTWDEMVKKFLQKQEIVFC